MSRRKMEQSTPKDLIFREFTSIPGGAGLHTELFKKLESGPGKEFLDLTPGKGSSGIFAAVEYKTNVSLLIDNVKLEWSIRKHADDLGVGENITCINATPFSIPCPDSQFDALYTIGNPFLPSMPPLLISECYRILKDEGMFGFAGPMVFQNETPEYMTRGLNSMLAGKLSTPALNALVISRDGFLIQSAEYITNAWDCWLEWLDNAPGELITDEFRHTAVLDGGRWLSLGMVILKKPKKPLWAP